MGIFSNDLAIDLGTASTLVFAEGRGVVCNEPSVVAVESDSKKGRRKVIAVGNEAKNMIGRCPDRVSAIRPLKGGIIADFEITEELLRYLIRKSQQSSLLRKPRVIISVPPNITEIEKRALKEAAYTAGAREVLLIPEPLSAGIGAGLPITEAVGNLVLDIGGGSSEISVISMKEIVCSRTLPIGGDRMDESIISYIKRKYNILIGEKTAEQLKIDVGGACLSGNDYESEISGRDLVHGIPRTLLIKEKDVVEALVEPVHQIAEMVKTALEKIPPELSADIYDKGIYMTGGGATLRNFDWFISQRVKLAVTLVEKPFESVVIGSGAILNKSDLLSDIIIN